MLGRCRGPLWDGDDLSTCFQTDWLQTLLPIQTCALSLGIIVSRLIYYALLRRHRAKKAHILIDVNAEESEDEVDSLSELTLQRTYTPADKNVDYVKPTGEKGLILVEILALFGQVAISIVSLVKHESSTGTHIERTTITLLCIWAYITTLALLRFLLTATGRQISILRLWNHTAVLYGCQWLLQIMIFRSVLIHPNDELSKDITIIRFALCSLLLAIALTSRKGNAGVALEYENDIEPSQEPLASLLSIATFSWVDAIVWRGYKKTLELSDVWNVALQDKAETVIASFRQVKKTHGLALRLLLHFKKELFIQGTWCVMSSIFMFVPTLLLQAILQYLEDPESSSANAAWLYVILLFVSSAIQAVGDGQSLWIGRKITIQLRAIIVGEIYSKTLRRKAAASADSELGKVQPDKKFSLVKRIALSWSKKKQPIGDGNAPPSNTKPAGNQQANNGTIINLMSIDSFKVADICAYLHFLIPATPVQLVMAVGLLYKVLGYSSFVGITLMILILPLNLFIAKSFQKAQKRIMTATDGRIHATNEVLQNIRIIKYFAWEQRFKDSVNEKRKIELSALWRKYILWASAATTWNAVPIFITFVSFWVYTSIEKRRLVPSIAFPALSMFSLLRVPLDQLADMVAHVQESKVSVDRVEEFLNEEETEKYVQLRHSKQDSQLDEVRIALDHATLTWGSKVSSGDDMGDAFRLINMDVEFAIGELNVIAGPTGSGKTSLLMALLGEMRLISGMVHIPGGSVRQDLRPDPATGLTESVAYCAQQAWLINANIRENILFASAYDRKRYQAVIAACALERDLEILDAGDDTLVGEKGIALSGGQKQRISLARALYCNSKHVLLDDCLSAVDSHTAKHIFEEAIQGELMQNRTCILVSHNITLAVPQAAFVVVLDNGKVSAKGTPQEVMSSGAFGEDISKSTSESRANSKPPSRTPSNLEQTLSRLSGVQSNSSETANGDVGGEPSKSHKKFVDTRQEAKAEGRIKFATIKMYLSAMGPWYYWIVAASGFVSTQIGSVATNVWIRQWANAYHTSGSSSIHTAFHEFGKANHYIATGLPAISNMQMPQIGQNSSSIEPLSASDHVDTRYYLGVYALIGAAVIVLTFFRELVLFYGSIHASSSLHEKLLHGILRAKFRFFDSTPLGQLTNRFSKDIQALDQEVAPTAIGLIQCVISVLTIVMLIAAIIPAFLIPGVFIALMYVATGLFYVRSSRDLKRIEAVQRSPLFQHFGETLTGVVTIRAYGDESRFIQESNTKVNTHNRPFIYLWATNRWLAFRIDISGAFVSFFTACFLIMYAGTIDPGAAGLALTYAITFTQYVLWLVRLYAANEQNMNAVERVQEYIDVEQEAPANIPETKPARNWPSHGAVQFVGYSTRYRSDLEPVLQNVSFRIAAAEKVGIVGRTGAGKSSLALALFRGLEAQEGKIIIDEVDIGLIGLQDLREAITIVPQDPTLFSGTLRSNLDPFSLFTDEEIFTALRRVQLIGKTQSDSGRSSPSSPNISSTAPTLIGNPPQNGDLTRSVTGTMTSDATLAMAASNTKDNKNIFYNLSTPVAESGSNLSQGQRQLLCLARALLKNPKVLVMDEATASIDYATDAKIQDTLRELKNNTIITIAHRLQTIIDYDKVLVLDKGEVIEYAHPWELVQKEDGSFRSMCETSGDFDVLYDLAKKAYQEKRLVDVDE